MYASFFGLNEKPFSITPDPRYLFLSERHAEALAHLVYGINEAGGFIQLTGEVGTGKTTVVRSLLAQAPKHAEIALILNPRMTPAEFLLAICEELGIAVPAASANSLKDLVDLLSRHLLRAHADGKRIVLVVDEAQNLAPEVLEQVRLLTNLETETQKLLQIILIGQPELRELLARTELRQLAQRITGRYHLDPLSGDEAAAYVRHRLRVAGSTREIFTNGALREVQRLSGGVPRLINIICDRALLGAFTEDRHVASASVVRRAAGEVLGRSFQPRWLPWAAGSAVAAIAVVSAALLVPRFWSRRRPVRPLPPSQRPPRPGRPPRRPRSLRPRWGNCSSSIPPKPIPTTRSTSCSRSGACGTRRAASIRAARPCSQDWNASRSAAHSRSCGSSTGRRCSTSSMKPAAVINSCWPASTRSTRSWTSEARNARSASAISRARGSATTCCSGSRPREVRNRWRWARAARACAGCATACAA
jgi:type II secretory pathway predicted ATPase ExeA